MDAFSLNISASSGVRKPGKQKNTFRAKKLARRAKVKAKKLGNVTQKPSHHQFGQRRNNYPRNESNHMEVETRKIQTVLDAPKVKINPYESAEAIEDMPMKQEEPDAMSDVSKKEVEVLVETQVNVECDPVATESIQSKNNKSFGTRRNPNKQDYNLSKFTQPRVQIDNELSKPLISSSSDRIFAANTFESMQMAEKLVNVLKKDTESGGFGFARPTYVQVQTIPSVLNGNDVLVKSETGSGKTLAYLLPIVQKLQAVLPKIQRQDGCMALVLAPTRELCTQILETANRLIQPFVYLVPGAIIGGEKKKAEKARLRKGITILIATPGRLADHLVNTQSFNYSRLQFLVLDEADRLLDMGFEKQLTQILTILDAKTQSQKRQNLLVSATVSSGVEQLAKMSLSNAVFIDADVISSGVDVPSPTKASSQDKFSTPHQLVQHFMLVPAKTRLCALTCFLREELRYTSQGSIRSASDKCKIVVFLSTCDAVDFHHALFRKCAWPSGKGSPEESENSAGNDSASLFGSQGPVFRLHGNIPQQKRVATFKTFCSSTSGILLCTDVAARGLNLPTVKWIVQYDPPTETRDYVHRVGRTARSGNQGSSLLFLMPSESDYLNYLSKQGLKLNALSLEKTVARVGKHGGFLTTRKKLLHEVVQSDLQFLFEQTLLADKDLFELACQAFHSFVRSYATHSSDTRNIFHVRSLHFGHVAKSFALRDPPASSKLRETGRNAKKGSLQKRKERDDKQQAVIAKKQRKLRDKKRHYAHNVSEFAD
ncbi:dead deah box rna [Plasmopara halstedii]|uniref:ATP-dependent RNA helicase n=1 Tax=Plasmopara halstedii TaxID=4781 RepID=A0A0P1A9W4_PLAHL|nr:dead deah box rna [Plasmopara halstedii]CEG37194.1 dead deah box rna [Plasmopara halstedii]|eukprot:XP_024573563.1 dead deah box rna [Plasmopara halstedii]